MKTLTLVIKQKWFDLIMSGEKTSEYRELTPYNANRLSELDEDGYLTETLTMNMQSFLYSTTGSVSMSVIKRTVTPHFWRLRKSIASW